MCPIYIFREREKEVIRDRVSESILGHFLQERESGREERKSCWEKEKIIAQKVIFTGFRSPE